MDGPLPKLCPAVVLSYQDGWHSAVALLLKAALIQGASGLNQYKNKFKNLIRTNKFKFSFRGLLYICLSLLLLSSSVCIHNKLNNVLIIKIKLNLTIPPGLDINVCPVPVKTDVGQVDLVLRLSDGRSEKIRDSQACRYDGQIYFHWYNILGLLYKRALFDLQFVHNLFWLKLKWNARSKLFYCIIYRSSVLWWSSRTLTKLKSQSQKRFNERKYQYLKYKNKNHSGTDT